MDDGIKTLLLGGGITLLINTIMFVSQKVINRKREYAEERNLDSDTISNLTDSIKTLGIRYSEIESDLNSEKEKRESLESKITSLRNKNDSQQMRINSLQDRVAYLEHENIRLNSDLGLVKTENGRLNNELEQVKTENFRLNTEVVSLQQELEQERYNSTKLRKRVNSLITQMREKGLTPNLGDTGELGSI